MDCQDIPRTTRQIRFRYGTEHMHINAVDPVTYAGSGIYRIWAKARFAGRRRPIFIRSGVADGQLFLDLCDEPWRCVEISKDGWRVLSGADSPAHFRRYLAMDALPAPVHGGAPSRRSARS